MQIFDVRVSTYRISVLCPLQQGADDRSRRHARAPDVVVTNPFAPDGVPATVKGNEALRSRMKEMGGLLRYDSVDDVTIHQTQDPEVVVVEFSVAGTITGPETTFKLSFVNVMRVVDGLIAESRDYGDAMRAAALFAALPAS